MSPSGGDKVDSIHKIAEDIREIAKSIIVPDKNNGIVVAGALFEIANYLEGVIVHFSFDFNTDDHNARDLFYTKVKSYFPNKFENNGPETSMSFLVVDGSSASDVLKKIIAQIPDTVVDYTYRLTMRNEVLVKEYSKQ